MRGLLITVSGLLIGYIAGNLQNNKTIEETIELIYSKANSWFESIKSFCVETLEDLEGFDSEEFKTNLDYILDGFVKKVDELYLIDNFEDKLDFIEDTIVNITSNLLKKSKYNTIN